MTRAQTSYMYYNPAFVGSSNIRAEAEIALKAMITAVTSTDNPDYDKIIEEKLALLVTNVKAAEGQ
jgi:hypothetical protein